MPTQPEKTKRKIVVVGGGTGTYTVLRGLKRYHDQLDLAAVVTMADAGGSTGRLRDEFGYLPVGDVRMALAALAADVDESHNLLRELFLYRFDRGEGLTGHNFGNLFLTALTDMLGSEASAIEAAGRILRVKGTVVPVTTDDVQLVATYADGAQVVGEGIIDAPLAERSSHRIAHIELTPQATISPEAAEVLRTADVVIFGPGDLYTSILPNCVVDGFVAALQESGAVLCYVSNLMTKAGQTVGMSACDHVTAVYSCVGRYPDVVFVNGQALPEKVVEHYQDQGEYPVADDLDNCPEIEVVRACFLTDLVVSPRVGDVVRRSLLRHDADKLAQVLIERMNL